MKVDVTDEVMYEGFLHAMEKMAMNKHLVLISLSGDGQSHGLNMEYPLSVL